MSNLTVSDRQVIYLALDRLLVHMHDGQGLAEEQLEKITGSDKDSTWERAIERVLVQFE